MNRALLKQLIGDAYDEKTVARAIVCTEGYIRAYCGVDAIPPELTHTAAAMTAAVLKKTESAQGNGVRSVKVGDTDVSFGDVGADAANAVLRAYNGVLNRYREVRFP